MKLAPSPCELRIGLPFATANFGECFEPNPLEHVQYLEWQEEKEEVMAMR